MSKSSLSKICLLLLPILAAPLLYGGEKRLISAGWDSPTSRQFRDSARKLEADIPYDGMIIRVYGKDDEGNTIDGRYLWQEKPFQKRWFQEAIDDLKAAQPQKLIHNFLTTCVTPGNLAWTDDEGWNAVAQNMGILAWIAKEGGLKGIALDPESYRFHQFEYFPDIGPTFEETAALARKRGHQVMAAIGTEYSDITLLAYWFFSLVSREADSGRPLQILPRAQYGLAPAFFSGMLEALPATATIIDGVEHAYHYNSLLDFQRAYAMIKDTHSPLVSLVPAELREKYARQVHVGFGIYLDGHVMDRTSNFHVGGPGDAPRLNGLKRNIASALAVADSYVWTWGEQSRWWDSLRDDQWTRDKANERQGKGRHWNEAFPGMTQAIIDGQHEAASLTSKNYPKPDDKPASGIVTKNLVKNPSFSEPRKGASPKAADDPTDWINAEILPAHYSGWQRKNSAGFLEVDKTVGFDDRFSARAQGVREGSFIQKINVTPGTRYRISARARVKGNGIPLVQLLWRNQQSKGMIKSPFNKMIPFIEPANPKEHEWLAAEGEVTVPENASILLLCLGISQQRSYEDTVWFDNISVFQLQDR